MFLTYSDFSPPLTCSHLLHPLNATSLCHGWGFLSWFHVSNMTGVSEIWIHCTSSMGRWNSPDGLSGLNIAEATQVKPAPWHINCVCVTCLEERIQCLSSSQKNYRGLIPEFSLFSWFFPPQYLQKHFFSKFWRKELQEMSQLNVTRNMALTLI